MVAFTANIGLAKPTDAEVAKNWIELNKYQEDNNLIIVDKTDVNFVQYAPVIKGASTDPSIGAGQIDGEYLDFQGFIQGTFVVEFTDPGVSVGLGEYAISLPAVVDNVFHVVGTTLNAIPNNSIIGEGYYYDNSTVGGSGTCALDVVTVGGVSYARLLTETHSGKTSRIVRDNMPSAVATNDKIGGAFFYKKL